MAGPTIFKPVRECYCNLQNTRFDGRVTCCALLVGVCTVITRMFTAGTCAHHDSRVSQHCEISQTVFSLLLSASCHLSRKSLPVYCAASLRLSTVVPDSCRSLVRHPIHTFKLSPVVWSRSFLTSSLLHAMRPANKIVRLRIIAPLLSQAAFASASSQDKV